MIRWLRWKELSALLSEPPSAGMSLNAFLHARTAVEPPLWFEQQPHQRAEPGLGETLVWAGVCDDMPFEIVATSRRTEWGFEVRFPDRVDGNAAMIKALRKLNLPDFHQVLFEHDVMQSKFALVMAGTGDPLYAASSATQCANVLGYLTDRGLGSGLNVVELDHG
jgi:hypothetical protein